MSILPEFLLNAYDSICDSDIVKNKNITLSTIEEFVYYLNHSIPKKYTPEYTIYLFNRTKYKVNRWKFIKDIHDTPYKSMILWTNYKEILKHFDLVQRFYLKWDKETNQYIGDLYDPSKSYKKDNDSVEMNLSVTENETKHEDTIKDKNEDKNKDNNIDQEEENEEEVNIHDQKKIEEYMDDQDRLLAYMQKKKKEMQEKMKATEEQNA